MEGAKVKVEDKVKTEIRQSVVTYFGGKFCVLLQKKKRKRSKKRICSNVVSVVSEIRKINIA